MQLILLLTKEDELFHTLKAIPTLPSSISIGGVRLAIPNIKSAQQIVLRGTKDSICSLVGILVSYAVNDASPSRYQTAIEAVCSAEEDRILREISNTELRNANR